MFLSSAARACRKVEIQNPGTRTRWLEGLWVALVVACGGCSGKSKETGLPYDECEGKVGEEVEASKVYEDYAEGATVGTLKIFHDVESLLAWTGAAATTFDGTIDFSTQQAVGFVTSRPCVSEYEVTGFYWSSNDPSALVMTTAHEPVCNEDELSCSTTGYDRETWATPIADVETCTVSEGCDTAARTY